jgi:hypothetical protein
VSKFFFSLELCETGRRKRKTHPYDELAGLHLKLVLLVPERHVGNRHVELHSLGLSGTEEHLGEGDELLDRSDDPDKEM